MQRSLAGAGIEVELRLRPTFGLDPPLGYEFVAILLTLSAPDAQEALALVAPALELVVDDLSFQQQSVIRVVQLEIIDANGTATVGETREILELPAPNGYEQWKFAQSTPLGRVEVAPVPALRPDYSARGRTAQQALDWYLKGAAATSDVDRFLFWWVALELLEGASRGGVSAPMRGPCGHLIDVCPTCDRSTTRRVAGPSLKAFLEARGVAPDEASVLWELRQVVHGRGMFGPDTTRSFGPSLDVLQGVVLAAVKEALGIPAHDPPHFHRGGMAIGRSIVLLGSRDISEDDLLMLA